MNESLRFHYRTVANLEKAHTMNETSRLSSMTGLTAFCYGQDKRNDRGNESVERDVEGKKA